MFSPIIKSDGSRIQQVLLNLQSNAIKFTSKGSIKIIVEITRRIFDPNEIEMENQDGLFLQVTVIDTGAGIKENQIGKLFGAFGYIDDGKELNTKGIGLGLNISKQITTILGGKIAVESVYGIGT